VAIAVVGRCPTVCSCSSLVGASGVAGGERVLGECGGDGDGGGGDGIDGIDGGDGGNVGDGVDVVVGVNVGDVGVGGDGGGDGDDGCNGWDEGGSSTATTSARSMSSGSGDAIGEGVEAKNEVLLGDKSSLTPKCTSSANRTLRRVLGNRAAVGGRKMDMTGPSYSGIGRISWL
jgi:hypothetical protein